MVSLTLACCLINAAPPTPANAAASSVESRAQAISNLPRYKVLLVPDGVNINLKREGVGGSVPITLLGVAPPSLGASLSTAFLRELIQGRDVALWFDPAQPRVRGRTAGLVYRLTDGLLVNLAMVRAGYGVTTSDVLPSHQVAMDAAEQEARKKELGAWSPAAAAVAAAQDEKQARLRDESAKGIEAIARKSVEKRAQRAQAKREEMAEMQKHAELEKAAMWKQLEMQATIAAKEEELRYRMYLAELQRRINAYPEVDTGSAAGAVALLIGGMLILADRRRASWARSSPTDGSSG